VLFGSFGYLVGILRGIWEIAKFTFIIHLYFKVFEPKILLGVAINDGSEKPRSILLHLTLKPQINLYH
jgi:hypothetical protein